MRVRDAIEISLDCSELSEKLFDLCKHIKDDSDHVQLTKYEALKVARVLVKVEKAIDDMGVISLLGKGR